MSVTIRIHGLANGEPTEFDNTYVVEYDPTRTEGMSPSGLELTCHLVVAPNIAQARQFRDAGEALKYWQQSHGLRPDGLPNRPLSAYSVEIG